MGKLSGIGSSKTLEIDSLDELKVAKTKKSKKKISKSQSMSEGLSQKTEKKTKKEKKNDKANAGENSNQLQSNEDQSTNDDSKRKPTIFNGLARRATIMRQKSFDNILQASKRLSMMPKSKSQLDEPAPFQPVVQTAAILGLPNTLLTNILFKAVFWTTLEFEYERQTQYMRTMSVVCKRFFEEW